MQICKCVYLNCTAIVLLFSFNICAEIKPSQTIPGYDTSQVKTPAKISQVNLIPTFLKWGLTWREQGARGTCGIFALVGDMEYVYARKHGKGLKLSVEYLNWASNQTLRQNIDGSCFSDMWNGFTAHGICLEREMPYRNTYDPNLAPSKEVQDQARQFLSEGFRLHWIKPFDIKVGITDQHLLAIKEALSQQWPVCAGIAWPNKPEWKKNVIQMNAPEDGYVGHGILLVGYRDDPKLPGGGVLMYRNSNSVGPRIGLITYEYALAYTNDIVWIDCELEEIGDSHLFK